MSSSTVGGKLRRVLTFIVLGLAIAVALLSTPDPSYATPKGGGTITRSEVISRAQFWFNQRDKIKYSQVRSSADPQGKPYRTDCSGYVSMAWRLGESLVTYGRKNLANVSTPLSSKDQLKPGDLMMASGTKGHAVLFEKWTDSTHTRYWAYEFGSTPIKHRTIPYPYDDSRTFKPYRYNNIVDGVVGSVPPSPSPSGPSCSVLSRWPSTKSHIDIWMAAVGRAGTNNACAKVGQSYTYTNPQYVWCRQWGSEFNDGHGNWNHWWLWTDLDTGGRGWISAYYIKGQGNDQANDMYTGKAIPNC